MIDAHGEGRGLSQFGHGPRQRDRPHSHATRVSESDEHRSAQSGTLVLQISGFHVPAGMPRASKNMVLGP